MRLLESALTAGIFVSAGLLALFAYAHYAFLGGGVVPTPLLRSWILLATFAFVATWAVWRKPRRERRGPGDVGAAATGTPTWRRAPR